MTGANKNLMNNKTRFWLIRLILLMIRHQQIIDKESRGAEIGLCSPYHWLL